LCQPSSQIKVLVINDSIYDNVVVSILKLKRKLRKRIFVICLGFTLCFSSIQPCQAIGLSMPPTSLVRTQPNRELLVKVKSLKVITKPPDRIFYNSSKEILFLIGLTDPQFYSNGEVSKIIKKLRGGVSLELGLLILLL
jgi:hypothetical protein